MSSSRWIQRRSFTLDDSDEDMRRFLEEVGYLHIRGLFSEEEMAAVEADYAKAAPHYEEGGRPGWFATTQDGERAPGPDERLRPLLRSLR